MIYVLVFFVTFSRAEKSQMFERHFLISRNFFNKMKRSSVFLTENVKRFFEHLDSFTREYYRVFHAFRLTKQVTYFRVDFDKY